MGTQGNVFGLNSYLHQNTKLFNTKRMLHIIGIPNCNKIKQTKDWLEEKGIDYELINVKKEPLTMDELKDLEFKVGLDVLINTRGMMYRKLELKEKNLSDDELMKVLLENQNMMKRPILVYEDSVMVGYDEEAFENFAKSNNLIED